MGLYAPFACFPAYSCHMVTKIGDTSQSTSGRPSVAMPCNYVI